MKFSFKVGVVQIPRSIASGNGNLFTVKIVPDMDGITDTDQLPLFPNFFKGNDIAYQKGDPVWCLCNDDFTVGFIMGTSQGPAGDNVTGVIQTINHYEQMAGFTPVSGYNDLSVIRVAGASIQFVNVTTGSSGTIFNNKAVFLVGSDGGVWIKNPGFNLEIDAIGNISLSGKAKNETLKEETLYTDGDSNEFIGGSKTVQVTGVSSTDSSGPMELITGSTLTTSVVGDKISVTGGKESETIRGSKVTEILAGSLSHRVLLGDYHLSVVAGNATLSVNLGTLNIYGGLGLNISSTTAIKLSAPSISIPGGMMSPTTMIPGAGFNSLPNCLYNGLPHSTPTLVSPAVVNTPPIDTTTL